MKSFDQLVFLCSIRGADPLWQITELFNGRGKAIKDCVKEIDGFAYDVIKNKREANAKKEKKEGGSGKEEERYDLLDHFMASRNDDDSELTDKQLRDAVMVGFACRFGARQGLTTFLLQNFTLAGRDTTAQTLSWCFWELAQRPEWEEKLRAEAMSVLGKDGPTTFESLKELPLTYAFFNEVRLSCLFTSIPAQS
jgi:cytochrome P450